MNAQQAERRAQLRALCAERGHAWSLYWRDGSGIARATPAGTKVCTRCAAYESHDETDAFAEKVSRARRWDGTPFIGWRHETVAAAV